MIYILIFIINTWSSGPSGLNWLYFELLTVSWMCWSSFTVIIGFLHYPQCHATTSWRLHQWDLASHSFIHSSISHANTNSLTTPPLGWRHALKSAGTKLEKLVAPCLKASVSHFACQIIIIIKKQSLQFSLLPQRPKDSKRRSLWLQAICKKDENCKLQDPVCLIFFWQQHNIIIFLTGHMAQSPNS